MPLVSRRERPAGTRGRGPRAPRSDAPRHAGAASDAPHDVETEPNVVRLQETCVLLPSSFARLLGGLTACSVGSLRRFRKIHFVILVA